MAWGSRWRSAARVVLAYTVIASLWILLSDRLLYLVQPDPLEAMRWAMYKGWAFVFVTAALLAVVLLAEEHSLARSHEALTRTERQMREAQDLVQLALEGASIGVWRHDVASGAVLLDERARTHFGLASSETTIEGMLGCLHPDDVGQARRDMLAQTSPGGAAWSSTEFRVVHPDGACRWLAFCARVQREPGTDTIARSSRAFGTTQDITARKTAEESLRRSEAEFRAIFEDASIGIAQADPSDGRLARFNETFVRITGFGPDELLGMRFSDLTHPDDRERDWRMFEQAREDSSRLYSIEKRYVRKDGSVVWVRVNATFIRDTSGVAVRTVATCEDITEQHEALQRLSAQHDELVRWRDATLGREERVLELKREVNDALALAGRPPRYGSSAEPLTAPSGSGNRNT